MHLVSTGPGGGSHSLARAGAKAPRGNVRAADDESGTLCLEHGRKMKEFVPLRLRTLVDGIVERNRAELEQELETFLKQQNTELRSS